MLKIISKFQALLPHFFFSKIIYWLANNKNKIFKNIFIKLFIKLYKVDLSEYEYKSIDGYSNFNNFFIRKLDLTTRNIELNSEIISPADGHVLVCEKITHNNLFQAKGRRYSISSLLASNKIDHSLFSNGSYFTIYLAPQDYHRVHMPCTGRLLSMSYIPGRLFSVNNTSCSTIDNIFARNERVVCIFKISNEQFMAVILVGALLVGSMATKWHGLVTPPHGERMVSDWNYQDQTIVLNKGDELGYFQMGSTVIVLFSDSINFKDNLVNNHVKFGDSLT